ncbi:hypothetical protein [Aeromicrobium sp.]|uniref:TetR/AcrR family transcriptional regulator n=1 Tax=Aeromicrobium sp. TaxID=1871063 RepID=UPI0019A0F6F0|nr:hypothetical protein [Aeromicrobium sp.]MBC7633018.1 TetR/AcrR family transcriptional regulator [Aeromicrobium sp.]
MPVERRRSTDGRIARGERTRDAIVAAHTELLREGVLKPTAKHLAERAGISLRTVWLNFNDLEALLRATTAFWLGADAELRLPVESGLALPDRIDRYCEQRTARLENLAPAARSAALGEPFSTALKMSRQAHIQRSLDDLEVTFAPELDAGGAEREVLLKTLFIATSWPSWITLRDDFGLDIDDATTVMRRSLTSLLA